MYLTEQGCRKAQDMVGKYCLAGAATDEVTAVKILEKETGLHEGKYLKCSKCFIHSFLTSSKLDCEWCDRRMAYCVECNEGGTHCHTCQEGFEVALAGRTCKLKCDIH